MLTVTIYKLIIAAVSYMFFKFCYEISVHCDILDSLVASDDTSNVKC